MTNMLRASFAVAAGNSLRASFAMLNMNRNCSAATLPCMQQNMPVAYFVAVGVSAPSPLVGAGGTVFAMGKGGIIPSALTSYMRDS